MEGAAQPPDALLRILDAVDSLLQEVDADSDSARTEELLAVRETLLERLRAEGRS